MRTGRINSNNFWFAASASLRFSTVNCFDMAVSGDLVRWYSQVYIGTAMVDLGRGN